MKETTQTKPSKLSALRRALAVLLAICLLIALFAVAAPTAKKKNVLKSVGGDAEADLRLIPAMLAYYDSDLLTTLVQRPGDTSAYRLMSDALAALRTAGGFGSVTLIVQSGGQYVCAADGLLDSGANVYAAGSLLSLEKPVKSMLGKLYDGKSEGGTVADLIDSRAGGSAACVLLPVFGADQSVLAVLAAEISVGKADYHIVGKVNLYAVAGVFAGVAALLGAVLYLTGKKKGKTPPPDGPVPPAADAPFVPASSALASPMEEPSAQQPMQSAPAQDFAEAAPTLPTDEPMDAEISPEEPHA